MSHYRSLLDPGEFLGPQDFPKPTPRTICRVASERMKAREEGKSDTLAPVLFFKDKEGKEYPRRFKVPKSVLYGLSILLGTETDAWVGKSITVFKARCMSFGDIEECLRVEFPPEIDDKIRKWLKKRKASAQAYMVREQGQS